MGILTGRVFRSDADVAGTPPFLGKIASVVISKPCNGAAGLHILRSFRGRSIIRPRTVAELLWEAFWGATTKNANVLKLRTNSTCASIIAWCMTPALTNAGLFVKLVQGLTEFGSYPAHIGLVIRACPAAGCFCHQRPSWPSQMMTIGAASGPLHLLEPLSLAFLLFVEIGKPL